MALPDISMRQLLEAGVHFGHQTHRWNPKMSRYIFGARNNIHIIDLAQTVPLFHQALVAMRDIVASGGRVLFVGTKRQASEPIAEAAEKCAQYFVNHRWLGGALTNWKTISNSIARLRRLEEMLGQEDLGLTKKELLKLTREKDSLTRTLGGIKDMGGVPDMMFVIDTNKEAIAVAEAVKLGIPVVGILDSNCNPDPINFPIPGNDDAGRAINLYCDLVAQAVLEGISLSQAAAGIDAGAAEEPMAEDLAGQATTAEAEAPGVQAPAEQPAGEAKPDVAAKAEKPKAAAKADKPEPKPKDTKEGKAEKPKAKATDGKPAKKKAPAAKAADEKDKAPAKKPAKTTAGFKPLKAAKGEADDLKKITGVGPVLENKLNEAGIYHYWQIAAFTADDIAKIDDQLNFKGRIERDNWLDQAKKLADGA
jgi:small subunit ribosomal protein S2